MSTNLSGMGVQLYRGSRMIRALVRRKLTERYFLRISDILSRRGPKELATEYR